VHYSRNLYNLRLVVAISIIFRVPNIYFQQKIDIRKGEGLGPSLATPLWVGLAFIVVKLRSC